MKNLAETSIVFVGFRKLLGIDPQELFIEIFDQIEENSGKMNMEMITDKLASMACKAAVKGSTTMLMRNSAQSYGTAYEAG